MDKDIRNALQRATQAARKLLEKEFGEQLEGTYDILPDGTILSEPGAHLDERQRLARGKIISAIGHKRAGGMSPQEAVAEAVREAAFTTLNRFAALKMLEARKLIQPCISAGDQSSGFKEFTGLAPGLATLPDKGYRLYLECLFDEIGCEVKVLFDRKDVASLLWPRRQALSNLSNILNDVDLVSVWEADETIGWIYQYFNGEDERRKMREKSPAPRNSRELAVRNQFFTPRYVVEFLTDNTLGRIWYEMMQAKTRIVDRCAYLVRRPKEIFLKDGEDPPAQDHPAEISQSELLKLPVYISFRKKKDPRDIRLLDPAGGSGHFLLYGFDLFLIIYEEAWHDEEAPASEITGQSIRTDYPTIEGLRLAIPGLILRHNLHGIDIDPRAAQIASLALWMRAQRAFSDYGIPRDIRPAIRKTNFVVAEPMPGEQELLKEFVDGLHPKALGDLVQVVFEKMGLAGEAGSLLKIEEEIHDAIAEAKEIWQREYMSAVDKHGRPMLFSERELGRTIPTQSGLFDVSDTDKQFWDKAENLLIDALHDYAKRAANGKGYQRRLFVEDAEQGFAFIDLCRKRYDVVLMNPPFGEACKESKDYIARGYPRTKNDIYAAFVERGLLMLFRQGMLGAITSRTGFFLSSFEDWRDSMLFSEANLVTMADLGHGVMDSAMVEAAAYCLSSVKGEHQGEIPAICLRLLKEENKNLALSRMVADLFRKGDDTVYCVFPSRFKRIPGFPFAYWIGNDVLKTFERFSAFDDEGSGRATRCGLGTLDDFRFIRLRWEITPLDNLQTWVPYFSGGTFSPFYEDFPTLVQWSNNGSEIKTFVTQKVGSASRKVQGEDHYFKPGFVFPRRTRAFAPKVMPAGGIFSTAGQAGFMPKDDLDSGIGLLSSAVCNEIISLSQGAGGAPQFEVGLVKRMPWPGISSDLKKQLKECFDSIVAIKRDFSQCAEISSIFSIPSVLHWDKPKLIEATSELLSEEKRRLDKIVSIQGQVNNIAVRLYELDRNKVAYQIEPGTIEIAEEFGAEEPEHSEANTNGHYELISCLISYVIGLLVGRWDIRVGLNHLLAPTLPDPFAPLPICPPGMLVGPDILPAQSGRIVSEEWLQARSDASTVPPAGTIPKDTITDSEYPLDICWNGILVDDPGHPDDIITRIHLVFDVIWQNRAHEIYAEAIEILDPGRDDLRPWFRANFFADHIKRYSKSRRKAPIYWCLSTPSRSYAVWLYYHRFSKDTFYKVLDCVKFKLQLEERKLATLRVEIGDSPTSAQRRQLADQEKFVAELKTFREEVALMAPLWKPDLNDGVIINFAPLWRLAPQPSSWQKECKQTWDALIRGDYDWAHLAMHLWPERVVPKCHKDRSLAIAHGLEESLWEQDEDGKWKPRDISRAELNDLIAARSSRSVKDALEKLLSMPATVGNGGRHRRG